MNKVIQYIGLLIIFLLLSFRIVFSNCFLTEDGAGIVDDEANEIKLSGTSSENWIPKEYLLSLQNKIYTVKSHCIITHKKYLTCLIN